MLHKERCICFVVVFIFKHSALSKYRPCLNYYRRLLGGMKQTNFPLSTLLLEENSQHQLHFSPGHCGSSFALFVEPRKLLSKWFILKKTGKSWSSLLIHLVFHSLSLRLKIFLFLYLRVSCCFACYQSNANFPAISRFRTLDVNLWCGTFVKYPVKSKLA